MLSLILLNGIPCMCHVCFVEADSDRKLPGLLPCPFWRREEASSGELCIYACLPSFYASMPRVVVAELMGMQAGQGHFFFLPFD